MNAKELRIGNWVNNIHTGNPYQINIAKMIRLLQHFKKDVIYFEPIPLTEEWFLKLGFKKYEDGFKINLNYGNFIIVEDDGSYGLYDGLYEYDRAKGYAPFEFLKHVHSLQNLYFELTGKEL